MVLKPVCVMFHLVHIPHTRGTDPVERIVETGVLSRSNTSPDCRGCCRWGKAMVRKDNGNGTGVQVGAQPHGGSNAAQKVRVVGAEITTHQLEGW